MTALTPNDRFVSLSPGAGTTVLAYDFELMLAEGMSVTRVRAGVSTPLTLGVDFSFPGGIGDETGGTLTLAVASLEADIYLLVGHQPEQRLSDFVASQRFDSVKMNADLDALTMVAQEHRRDIDRSWKSALGSVGQIMPAAVAGLILGWNAAGTAIENKVAASLGIVQILDEADLATNSHIAVPSQHSVKAYVDAGIATRQPLDLDLTSWAALTRPAAFDTFVATPTAANLRSLVGGVTGTGSLVFANTPTLVAPVLGEATASSISMSGGAGVSHTFTGSGLAANIWVNQSCAALSATVPEIGAQFTMTSNLGIANTTTAYKIAATFSVLGGTNSASIYGTNTIMQGYGGAGGYLITGNEVDINNLGATAATLASPTAVYGFIAVAAGGFNSTAAFNATGSGVDWTYGFATWLNGVKGVGHSDFRAESTATNILTATGARTNGVDVSGATFSGLAFKSPGFTVDGTGSISTLGIQFAGSTAVAGPSVFQNTNVLVFAGGTSGFAWDNQAVGAQLMRLSNVGLFEVLGDVMPFTDISNNIGSAAKRIGGIHCFNLNATNEIQFNATKVVGARKTGWAVPTGTFTRTTYVTSTVTLPQLAERVAALIQDFHNTAGHGLIGT